MTYIDLFILAIVAISTLVGFFRGFFPEVIAVLTWVAAALGGLHLSGWVEPHLAGKLGSGVAELWASRAILFVVILIVGGLLGQLVALLLDKAGLSGTDKMLGLAFGFVRGAIVVGVLVVFAQLVGFQKDAWWSQSKLLPFGETIAAAIRSVLPASVSRYIDSEEVVAPALPRLPDNPDNPDGEPVT